MCGIAGIARPRPRLVPAGALARMVAALAHRGPDGRGVVSDGPVGLAHARLSIVDPEGGAQPLAGEDGRVWVTYNGEVYNHAELRRELEGRGHRFRTRCDTEVLVHGWEEWGRGMLERLNGQFAFALHDRRDGSLFLARDRFGVHPLVYAVSSGDLVFASEPAALFASGMVEAAPDARGVDQVLTFWAARAPRTVFRGVRALEPGGWARWRDGCLVVGRWWAPEPPAEPVRPADAVEELDARMRSAVALRLRADVPVGAYLSGGMDSSALCAVAAGGMPHALRTFSVAFDDAALDERGFQRAVAGRLGTRHVETVVSAGEVADVFPAVVRHAATPLLRTAAAPLYLLARRVRESGVRVVLTGEGADELFLGYDLFREAAVRAFCLRRPESAGRRRLFARLYPYLDGRPRGEAWSRWFLAAGDPADPLFSHLPRWLLARRARDFLEPSVRAELDAHDPVEELRGALPPGFSGWAPWDRAAYLERATLLEPYLLASQGDRVSLAHGVEARYPFLDPRVDALAAALPLSFKRAGLREKALLRRWAAPLLPAAVGRRAKQPYRAPDAPAFFGAGRPGYVDALLSPGALRETGWWEPRAVAALVARCRAGRATAVWENQALVAILSTQLWHHHFFGAGRVSLPPGEPLPPTLTTAPPAGAPA